MSREGRPAYELLREGTAEQIADVLYRFGEERNSRRISKAIVSARRRGQGMTASRLAGIVAGCYPPGRRRIHPATRSFQALRIWANNELSNLEAGLRGAVSLLKSGGRLVVISYHSLEDRLVKGYFRSLSERKEDNMFILLTKKPIQPARQEVNDNPRSRSAKLRAVERAA